MTSLIKRLKRKERKQFDRMIQEQSKQYERTLDEDARKRLIELHTIYKMKFGREYGK